MWRGTSFSTLLHVAVILLTLFGLPALPSLFDRTRSWTVGEWPPPDPDRPQPADAQTAPPDGDLPPGAIRGAATDRLPGAIEVIVIPQAQAPDAVQRMVRGKPGAAGAPDTGPKAAADAATAPGRETAPASSDAGTAAPPVGAGSVAAILRDVAHSEPSLAGLPAPPGARQPDAAERRRLEAMVRRLQRAARVGHSAAQKNLAIMLLRGAGARRDPEAARRWLERAAERGYAPAQLVLGFLAAGGGGRRDAPDLGTAAFWWTVAERNGSAAARRARSALAPLMSPRDQIRARRRLTAWLQLRSMLGRDRPPGAGDAGPDAALQDAAGSGKLQDLLAALSAGADPDGRDIDGRTAMINAAWRGRGEVVRILILHGADVRRGDATGRTPLIWSAINGQTAVVDQLLAAGSNPDHRDAERRTALMRAAWNGHRAIVAKLLAAGARPDLVDGDGFTAEMLARRGGRPGIAALLHRAAVRRGVR